MNDPRATAGVESEHYCELGVQLDQLREESKGADEQIAALREALAYMVDHFCYSCIQLRPSRCAPHRALIGGSR